MGTKAANTGKLGLPRLLVELSFMRKTAWQESVGFGASYLPVLPGPRVSGWTKTAQNRAKLAAEVGIGFKVKKKS